MVDDKALILLVDDEPANIQLVAGYIKDDYHIKVATSGEQCLKLAIAEHQPDLILLDVDMPNMTGYQVCERLKQDPRTASIAVMFLTSMQTELDEERALEIGAVDYLTKPVRPAILVARINTHIKLKKQHDSLINMAMKDQLTGLYNRHYLLETANHRVARAMRQNISVSLLVIDLDHFKQINDTRGHSAGDSVLRALSQLLQQECRQEDIIARFGGEEFVIFLDDCDRLTAARIAERIRQRLEGLSPDGIDVTASIGVAELKNGKEGFSELVKRADDAMYEAKNSGRNKVISY